MRKKLAAQYRWPLNTGILKILTGRGLMSILPPLLNVEIIVNKIRTLKLGHIWARWPAKPPCSLLSIGIVTKILRRKSDRKSSNFSF